MLSNIRIVRNRSELPLKESGFSRISSYPRHRCDLVAEGFALESGEHHYDFDNRVRRMGCLFQYTFAGEGRFQILPDGKPVMLTPGMGFLVRLPSLTRYWLAPGTEWDFCYVILDGDMACDLVGQLVRQYGHVWKLPPTHPAIDVIRGIHRRVLDGHIPDEFESASMAHRFLMELFRAGRNPDKKMSPAIERVIRLIERNYKDPDMAIDRIAKEGGYSRYHLSRMFRREVGASPYAYLQQFRMQRALNLVTTTELPIKQIVFESGYRDFAYFCKEFKRWTRKTPMEVRKLGDQLNLSTIHTG